MLDISTLTSPAGKESQHLALQMVKMLAAHVENASFLQRLREHWVQRLSRAPQFLEVSPEYLLAPDAAGRVVGHKRQARLLLEGARGLATVIGRPLPELLDLELHQLGLLVPTQAVEQHAAALPASRDTVLLLASPPPVRLAAPTLDRLIERAARPVRSPVNILLTGETGSGKERFARALHDSSERRRQTFVAVNCTALPESLTESELFGHLAGSFSGAASRGKHGLVQEADGGTLFLDEIGDMLVQLLGRPLIRRLFLEHMNAWPPQFGQCCRSFS